MMSLLDALFLGQLLVPLNKLAGDTERHGIGGSVPCVSWSLFAVGRLPVVSAVPFAVVLWG